MSPKLLYLKKKIIARLQYEDPEWEPPTPDSNIKKDINGYQSNMDIHKRRNLDSVDRSK